MNHIIQIMTELPSVAMLLAGVLGLCMGSFLNVVAHRLPIMLEAQWEGQPSPLSLHSPASRCPECLHPLSVWDNIPVFSYLITLKGQCRYCGVKIPATYPLVEALTCLMSILVVWHFKISIASLCALCLVWALIALSLIDFKTQLLPDDMTLPLLWMGLLVNLSGTFVNLSDAVLGSMVGYMSLWLIYWAFKLITHKEGMGYGDFKLMAALGAWLGCSSVPWILFYASIISAIFGGLMILFKKSSFENPIPFGPFLALAGTGWLLY